MTGPAIEGDPAPHQATPPGVTTDAWAAKAPERRASGLRQKRVTYAVGKAIAECLDAVPGLTYEEVISALTIEARTWALALRDENRTPIRRPE